MADELAYAALYATASKNGGLLTLAQAAAAGFAEAEQRRLVAGGAWLRAGRGLRRLAGYESAEDAWQGRLRTAVLLAGADAVAAGHSAARLHAIAGGPADGRIWLAVPKERHPQQRPGVKVMRTIVRPEEIVVVDGTPATTPLRALLDSARYGDQLCAVCLIESAVRNDMVRLPDLRSEIAAIRGKRGSARAAAALARVDVRSESPLETQARLLLIDAGLPAPRLQEPAAPDDARRIDLAYLAPDHSAYRGLAIEIDGREVHAQADAFHRDPIRQTKLEEAGWLFRRFTHRHLSDVAYVVGTVRRGLEKIEYLDK